MNNNETIALAFAPDLDDADLDDYSTPGSYEDWRNEITDFLGHTAVVAIELSFKEGKRTYKTYEIGAFADNTEADSFLEELLGEEIYAQVASEDGRIAHQEFTFNDGERTGVAALRYTPAF